MNSDRIKEIQETTAYPQSRSVYQALLQVWNECAQEQAKNISTNPVLADSLIAYQKWCNEHPEYDQVTETPKVQLYLKAANVR